METHRTEEYRWWHRDDAARQRGRAAKGTEKAAGAATRGKSGAASWENPPGRPVQTCRKNLRDFFRCGQKC